jgi:hypothetical protein
MSHVPPYSMTDILTDFSYAVAEQTVPSSGIEDRKAFIQRSLEEAHRYADWDWAKATATTQLTSGIATLATTVALSPSLDVRILASGTNADKIFTQIPYEAQDSYGAGDYKYWLTGNLGSYRLNTTESTDSSSVITYRYDTVPADLVSGESTKFPSSLTLAQGALRYYRASRDPEYDVSQDQAIWEQGLENLVGLQNSTRPIRRARTARDVSGAYIGDIG